MTGHNNTDWKERLEQIESEINQFSVKPMPNAETRQTWLRQISNWFDSLPTIAKVGVGIVGVIIGLSLLNTVLRLITALITIAILGGIGLFVYNLLVKSSSSDS